MLIVVGKETAKEAWDAIIQNFSRKLQSRIMEFQTKLHNLRKSSMMVDTYVQTVRYIGDKLRANGSNINMHDLSFALLRGLDQQYNAFYASTSQLLHTQVNSLHLLISLKLKIKFKEIIEEGEKIAAEVVDRKLCLDASSALKKDIE